MSCSCRKHTFVAGKKRKRKRRKTYVSMKKKGIMGALMEGAQVAGGMIAADLVTKNTPFLKNQDGLSGAVLLLIASQMPNTGAVGAFKKGIAGKAVIKGVKAVAPEFAANIAGLGSDQFMSNQTPGVAGRRYSSGNLRA